MAPVIDAYARGPVRAGPPRGPPRTDRGLPGRRRARRPGRRRRSRRPRPRPTRRAGDCDRPAEPAESAETETAAESGRDRARDRRRPVASRAGRRVQARPDQVKWNVCRSWSTPSPSNGATPTATETCEIVGVGPVDVDWVRQILPDALVDVLVHDLVDIQAHATITRHRKRALDKRAPGPRPTLRRPRLQTPTTAPGRPPPRLRQRRPDLRGQPRAALRGPPRTRRPTAAPASNAPPPNGSGTRHPPTPGEPEPPPGSIPWRAPIGEHLTAFDLTDLPPPDHEPTEPSPTTPCRSGDVGRVPAPRIAAKPTERPNDPPNDPPSGRAGHAGAPLSGSGTTPRHVSRSLMSGGAYW